MNITEVYRAENFLITPRTCSYILVTKIGCGQSMGTHRNYLLHVLQADEMGKEFSGSRVGTKLSGSGHVKYSWSEQLVGGDFLPFVGGC